MPRDPAADELDAALNASAVSGIARLLRSRLLASPIRQEEEPAMSTQQGQQSAPQAAPPATVNLAQLDSLVRQYMVVEDIVEGAGQDDATRVGRRQCEAVRDAVRRGDVTQGLVATDAVDSTVLQDPRLLFQLKKQELMELLRRSQDPADALDFVRDGFSALALDSYPEAYAEFNQLMLAFIYSEDPDTPAPVAELWKLAQREKLADMLAATLKQAVGGHDSNFTTLLRYLLVTARSFHGMRDRGGHACGAACALASELLLPERSARPLAPETSATFPEATVQALGQAAEMSREDAIAALKRSGGNVDRALKAELGCFRLNTGLLEELAWEYALSRDLVRAPADSPMAEADHGLPPRAAEAAAALAAERTSARAPSPMRADRGDEEGDSMRTSSCGNWRQRSRSPPPRRPARWRTHQDPAAGSVEDAGPAGSVSLATDKFAAALKVKQAAAAGRFDEVEAELRRLDDNFFADSHPKVLFEVRRCQFSALVEAGKQQEALAFARKQLTPIAGGDAELMQEVKAAMGAILMGGPPTVSHEAAAAGLQKSVCEALGLQEPRLVELLGTLLAVHAIYFQRQRCRDRFEGALGIHALREAEHPAGGAAAPQPAPDAGEAAGGDACMEPVDSEEEGSDEMEREGGGGEEGGVTEHNITVTMEFSNLPRVQVIDLLMQHGSPEAVMQQLFN